MAQVTHRMIVAKLAKVTAAHAAMADHAHAVAQSTVSATAPVILPAGAVVTKPREK